MEKDNKVLLGAVLILLVAMLSFNFNSVTGEVTKDSASLKVSPTSVYFSQEDLNSRPSKIVSVKVSVNSGSIENELYLFRSNGVRTQQSNTRQICESKSSCGKGTYAVDFKIGTELPDGEYYFAVNGHRETLSGSTFGRQTFTSNMVSLTKYTEPNINYEG